MYTHGDEAVARKSMGGMARYDTPVACGICVTEHAPGTQLFITWQTMEWYGLTHTRLHLDMFPMVDREGWGIGDES